MQRTLFFIFIIICSINAHAEIITGQVLEGRTNAPIAFVNIAIPGTYIGTTTDIDGKFELKLPINYKGKVVFSHVSFIKREFLVNELINTQTIYLEKSTTNLDEVTFIARENPAHRIIRQTIANKDLHNPAKMKSYTYKSYNKEVFKIDVSQLKLDEIQKMVQENDTLQLTRTDSLPIRMDNFANMQHVLLIESVAETKFASPGMVNEKIIATKISGLNSPLFASTGSQYRSFGFYEDVIRVLDKEYLNPLMNAGLSKYEYYIEDTTFYQSDTVYVISFEPQKGKRFDGFKGMLSICVNGYAIKNVMAESADINSTADIRIQQLYERIDGQFFPVQLNTDVTFKENSRIGAGFKMEGRSYLSEINLEPDLSRRDFSDVIFEIPRIDNEENTLILKESRFKPLDSLDIATYNAWDTVAHKLEKYVTIAEILATGKVPLGPFSININNVISSNQYEQLRIGIGGNTNSKFLDWASFGGYVAYGIGDIAFKYGGNVQFELNERTSSFLRFTYRKDIAEVGRVDFFDSDQFISEQLLRNFQGSLYDKIEQIGVEFKSRIFPFTYSSIRFIQESRVPTYDYLYSDDGTEFHQSYNFSEASLSLRYIKGEGYVKFMDTKLFAQFSYPAIAFKVTKGFDDILNGEFDYTRYDFSFDYKKRHRLGKTALYIKGSLIEGDFPLGKSITGWGNKGAYFNVPNYFQTMGLYEFVSDKLAGLFVNHNFGNILIDNKFSKPELVVYHNAAIGELTKPDRHYLYGFNTMEKGYYEGGLGFRNLIRFNYMQLLYFGFGADGFYRYGSYAFPEIADNFAVTFNMSISF